MTAPDGFISYAAWGEEFFRVAVTEERIHDAVDSIAGRPMTFGPSKLDPLGLVKVSAHGEVGRPRLTRRSEALVAFDLLLPVRLRIALDIGPDKHRYDADVLVRLILTARAARPLTILIDIDEPRTKDVTVALRTAATRSSVIQALANIDNEVKRVVVKFVRTEIGKPEMRRSRTIDVAALIAGLTVPRKQPLP